MTHDDIQKEAFAAAAATLARTALSKGDKLLRTVGRKAGGAGKKVTNKALKPTGGSLKGKFNLTHAKNQRIAGGAAVGTAALGAGAMAGGEEKKASREGAQLGAFLGGPIGAAVGAGKGRRSRAAGGTIGGGIAGAGVGGAVGALAHKRTGGLSTLAGSILGSGVGSVVGAGAGHDSADKARKEEEKGKKKMKKKAEAVFAKLSGYTTHGKMREEAKALANSQLAEDYDEAGKESPGMDYLKGTHIQPAVHKLVARKQAYKAKQKGTGNLKSHIPFVGMGSTGQKALEKLKQEKK